MNCAFTISKYFFGYFITPMVTISALALMGLSLIHSENVWLVSLGIFYFIILLIIPFINIGRWLYLSASEAFMITMVWGSFILYLTLFSHVNPLYPFLMALLPIIPTFKAIGDRVLELGRKLISLKLFKGDYLKDRNADQYQLEDIDQMSGEAFEHYIANLISFYDFKKIRVSSYSNDKGLDIYAEQDKLRYGFQCKRWGKNVTLSAVQEIYTAKDLYELDKIIVITNSGFTKAAIDAAIKLDVILIDRKRLGEMIRNIQPAKMRNKPQEVAKARSSKNRTKITL
ncbi:restriction endonuclease [Ignatzschineria rhizosphaerae]|uniref:Restriction endonuclease n=1 Tax=Ignatzschineria rhizosphaerae TaxID=2923279 RepID=A0ABY3X6F9_9GAMM|nr:restriction endonuclease [Ignatzschineria rhizosphaerae]UNM97341.1 restriction endonuclease [Ignatzschineria rhizosphaerae]